MNNQEELSRISARVDAYMGWSNHRGPKQLSLDKGTDEDDSEDILEIPVFRKSEKTKYDWGSKYYDAVQEAVFTVKNVDSPVQENLDASKKLYKCYQCNDSFRFLSSLKDHLQRKSWILGYWCEMCYVTKCTHERPGTAPCANCVELDTLKKLYFTVKGLKKDQKIGRIKIFLNQCQFFSHLKMHSISVVDACDIMLMPLPCNVRSVNYFQLFKMCEAVMEQMFINQTHIMDWLESMNFNDRWWQHGEDDIDTPITRIVSTYQDNCFSDTSDLYLARYNMKLLLNKLESPPKKCTSTWEQRVYNSTKKPLVKKPIVANNNNRLKKVFPLKAKVPQVKVNPPIQVLVMPEVETTSQPNQVNAIPQTTDKSSESSSSKSLPIILRKKKLDDSQIPTFIIQKTPTGYRQVLSTSSSKIVLKTFNTKQKTQKVGSENRRKSPPGGSVTHRPNSAPQSTESVVCLSEPQSNDKLEELLGINYGTNKNYRPILPKPGKNLVGSRKSYRKNVGQQPQAEPTVKPVTDIKTEPIISDVKCETLSPPVSPKLEPFDDDFSSERHQEDEYIIPDTDHMDFRSIDNSSKENETLSKPIGLENSFVNSNENQEKYIVLQPEEAQSVVPNSESIFASSDMQPKLSSEDGKGEFILPTQMVNLSSVEEFQTLKKPQHLLRILPKTVQQNPNTQPSLLNPSFNQVSEKSDSILIRPKKSPGTSQIGNYAVSKICPATTLAAKVNHIIPTTSNSTRTTTSQSNLNKSIFPVSARSNNANNVSVLKSPVILRNLKTSKNLIPILPKPDFASIPNLQLDVSPPSETVKNIAQSSQSKTAKQKRDRVLKICNVRSLADPKEPININKKETVNSVLATKSKFPLTRVSLPWKTLRVLEDDGSKSSDELGKDNTTLKEDLNSSNTDSNSSTTLKDDTEKKGDESLKQSFPSNSASNSAKGNDPVPGSSQKKPIPVRNGDEKLVLQKESFATQVIKTERTETAVSPVTKTILPRNSASKPRENIVSTIPNTSSILKEYMNGNKVFYRNGHKYIIRPVTCSSKQGDSAKGANGTKNVTSILLPVKLLSKSGEDTSKNKKVAIDNVSKGSPMNSSTRDSPTASTTSASSGTVPIQKPQESVLEESVTKVNPFDPKNQEDFKDYYTTVQNEKGEDVLERVLEVAEKPTDLLAVTLKHRQELLNSINSLSRDELKKCQSHLLSTNEKFMRILKISNGSRLIRSNLNAISCFLKACKAVQGDPAKDERYRINEEFEQIATEWERDFLLCGKISKCTICKKVVKPTTYKCGLSKSARNENSYCSCYNRICPKCHIYMGSLARFKDHWDYHNHSENKDLLFKCPQCTRKFPSFKRLEAHEWSYCFHTLSRIIYKCTICQFDGFFHLEALASHFAVMHSENRFCCPVCSVVVPCWAKFQEHMRSKHPENSYQAHEVWMKACRVGGCLVKAGDFQAHMFEHLGVLQISYFKCPFCPFNYRDSSRGRTVFKEHLYKIHFQRLSKVMTKETYERLFPAGQMSVVFQDVPAQEEDSRNSLLLTASPGVSILKTRTTSSLGLENNESVDKHLAEISEETIKIESVPSPVPALTSRNLSTLSKFFTPDPENGGKAKKAGKGDETTDLGVFETLSMTEENSKRCGTKRVRKRNLLKKRTPGTVQKRAKTRCKIALNEPIESTTPPVIFRCHICRELINSSWRIMKSHFDLKHSDEYEVSILNPKIERMTLKISDGEIHLSQRKRKAEDKNLQSRRRRKPNSKFPFHEDFIPL